MTKRQVEYYLLDQSEALYYSNEAPYDASLLARFRERINVNLVNQLNERMVNKIQSETKEEAKKKDRKEKVKKKGSRRIEDN